MLSRPMNEKFEITGRLFKAKCFTLWTRNTIELQFNLSKFFVKIEITSKIS